MISAPTPPPIDDLSFQDIVNRVKSQIAIYCPEWTDHNVSDPGVTLIELFASMAEMLLYRVNRLPEQAYRAFLDLIGARLEPARPATADVTFYLAAGATSDIAIGEDTEVATVRTESSAPIVFSTTAPLTIRPANLLDAYCAAGGSWIDARLYGQGDIKQTEPDAKSAADTSSTAAKGFSVFARANETPQRGNALYLRLGADHSMHVLALKAVCERAGGGGALLGRPPWVWEVSAADGASWTKCVVERDDTGGFNREGANELILRLPAMGLQAVPGDPKSQPASFWLRCRLSDEQGKETEPGVLFGYNRSPRVTALALRSIGGTVPAQQAQVVWSEQLGISDGTPYQSFRLRNAPLLARDPAREHLVVTSPDGIEKAWQEVAHFADSRPEDTHYTLDHTGTVRFGPLLAQPKGKYLAFGATPPKGSKLKFARYRYGGGVIGNVPERSLVIRKVARPEIARVINWEGAIGGRDAQTIEDARLRAPAYLSTRTRAVTQEDFVDLAARIEGVRRAACLAADRPGTVNVVVLPEPAQDLPTGPFDPKLELGSDDPLIERVRGALAERALLGVRVEVRPPQYVRVKVSAEVSCDPSYTAEQRALINQAALAALYRFLHPYTGGPSGAGWPFGRRLSDGMIKHVLNGVPGVELAEQVLIWQVNAKGKPAAPGLIVDLPPDGVICSDMHDVQIL